MLRFAVGRWVSTDPEPGRPASGTHYLDVDLGAKVEALVRRFCATGPSTAKLDLGSAQWFYDYHARWLTEPFLEWWIGFMLSPDTYKPVRDYWTRMAYALFGWREHERQDREAHQEGGQPDGGGAGSAAPVEEGGALAPSGVLVGDRRGDDLLVLQAVDRTPTLPGRETGVQERQTVAHCDIPGVQYDSGYWTLRDAYRASERIRHMRNDAMTQSGPVFLRCKNAIIEVESVAAIRKHDEPGVMSAYSIVMILKTGHSVVVDFSHDDEACGPEPRDRAFEDLWLALKGKARQWAS